MPSLPLSGRGASENPPNRFDRLAYVPEPGEDFEAPGAPETEFYRDSSRSLITRNDSPDVGFEASVNPYRGCEHGCIYCLGEETPILMADGTTRRLLEVREGDAVYGTVRQGAGRRYTTTRVLAHWQTRKAAYRLTLAAGVEIIASADHRLLTERGWKQVAAGPASPAGAGLTRGDSLLGVRDLDGDPERRQERSGSGLIAALKTCLAAAPVKAHPALRVAGVKPLGVSLPMVDITTGTGDFIASGVVSHNCYARPTHEYFGLSAGLDFESKIFVKEEAPKLLRQELSSPRWKPQVLAMSGVTDPYQPIERRLELTRRCLEVLAEFRNPVVIITKNHLVTRDKDLLAALAGHGACAVFISVTSLRPEIHRVMEPRTSNPRRRLEAIRELAASGIPVGVLAAPVVPGLTDHELPAIIAAAAAAGARHAGYVLLRLPYAVRSLFTTWLENHFPERREKVLNRIRSLRGGELNDPRFGSRMRGEGIFAEQLTSLFRLAVNRAGIELRPPPLSTAHFRSPADRQLELF